MTTTTSTRRDTDTATYTKLRDGSWGLRIQTSARDLSGVSTQVSVRTKAGATKIEQPGRVIWTGDGVMLTTIERTSHSSPRLRWDGTYECEECGDFVRRGTRCWETGRQH